jgi:hypothetical protein
MNLEKLQTALDQLIESEVGAELLFNAQEEVGAIAVMVVVPELSDVHYVLLKPSSELPYEPIRSFTLYDFMIEKAKKRVILRSDSGTIYVVRPIQSDEARNMFTFHSLDEQLYKEIKDSLTPQPTWAELHVNDEHKTGKEALEASDESI